MILFYFGVCVKKGVLVEVLGCTLKAVEPSILRDACEFHNSDIVHSVATFLLWFCILYLVLHRKSTIALQVVIHQSILVQFQKKSLYFTNYSYPEGQDYM